MISSVQYVEAKQTEFIPQKIFRLISPGPSLYSINFRSWVKPILTSLFIFLRGGGGGVRRRGGEGSLGTDYKIFNMSETVFYVKENITNSEKDPNKTYQSFH